MPEVSTEVKSISNEEWIAFLFDNLPDGCLPVATGSALHPEHLPDHLKGGVMKGITVVPGLPLCKDGPFAMFHPDKNTYLNCASFRPEESGWFRKEEPWYGALHAVMIDDVGKKVAADSLSKYPPPTMKLQTSEGNWQWIYKLNPPIPDYNTAKQFVAALVRAVPNDSAGPSRWMRMPVGYNTKKAFRHQITELAGFSYSPDQLIKAFGLELVPEPVRGAPRKVAGADAIANWLATHGHIKKEGHGWLEITCPWSHVYTSGGHDNSNGTKYFLPSEGYPSGGFKCQHSNKCGHRTVRDLIAWCVGQAQREVA